MTVVEFRSDGGRLLVFLTVAFPNDSSRVLRYVGARSPESEKSLEIAFEAEQQDEVRKLRRDEHDLDADCWFHTPGFCLSRSPL
jgi:hypothetical protein